MKFKELNQEIDSLKYENKMLEINIKQLNKEISNKDNKIELDMITKLKQDNEIQKEIEDDLNEKLLKSIQNMEKYKS